MDTEVLKTVVLVAQQGSFASAARVLNIDPSSVSRTVAAAEASLGLRLFQRTTRSMTVTEEGEAYIRRVTPLLEELDAAQEAACLSRQNPNGTSKITSSVAFTDQCVVPHLSEFRAQFPEVSVELLPTDATIDIAANGIDLAIRLGTAPSGDLISTRLLRTRYVVCASPDYVARHPKIMIPLDLRAHDCPCFALPEFRTNWRFRRSDTEPLEVPVTGSIVIGNALSLRRAALMSLGPVLLADWLVGKDIRSGRLVDLFPDYECTATEFDTGAWALYPYRTYLPQKVRVMIDFMRQKLAP